jgi:hypothetical protein
MPLDKRNDSRAIAVIYGDVVGSKALPDRMAFQRAMKATTARLNKLFYPAIMEPFAVSEGDRIEGAITDPAQAPLCISVLRETLAPVQIRIGVGVGPAITESAGETDAFKLARHGLQLVSRDGGLTRYVGLGEAGDVLLTAICRLADPLIKSRTAKQWEAIAAYRTLGHQHDIARQLGVTRQSVGDRLSAGHRRAVEEADVAIATYLSHMRRQRQS